MRRDGQSPIQKSLFSYRRSNRVDLGAYAPRSLPEPDVRISRIRLFGWWFRSKRVKGLFPMPVSLTGAGTVAPPRPC